MWQTSFAADCMRLDSSNRFFCTCRQKKEQVATGSGPALSVRECGYEGECQKRALEAG